MGVRRKARELALKVLFENEFSDQEFPAIMDRVQKENEVEADLMQFLQILVSSFGDNSSKVDDTIEQFSSHWKINRMALVDRNILRLGATEILFLDDIPKNVTINEYLEIAKKFGSEDSSSFVNGILDKVEKKA